jgi:hypothetical protein
MTGASRLPHTRWVVLLSLGAWLAAVIAACTDDRARYAHACDGTIGVKDSESKQLATRYTGSFTVGSTAADSGALVIDVDGSHVGVAIHADYEVALIECGAPTTGTMTFSDGTTLQLAGAT